MSWPMVKLASVADVERSSVQPDAIADGTRYLGLEHIESGGQIIGGDPIKNGDVASSKFAFSNEHVLYGKLRPYLAKIALPDFEGVCSTDILPVRPKAKLDRRYLAYFLRQPDMVAKANSLATGANLPRLSPKALEQIEIPLPPLEEQKRIAGILDQADALRRLRVRAIEKLNTLGQAVFQEMFGDPQSNWPQVAISNVTKDARTGPFGSQLLVSEFVDSGIPVLGIDNVVQNKFLWAKERFITLQKYEQLRRYQVNPGDVLVTIMGTCGRCAVAPHDIGLAINTKHICCMTMQVEKIEPEFLRATLLWDACVLAQLGVEAKGAIMPGLNMSKIASLKFRLPPLEMQKIFIERIENIQADLIRVESATSKAEALFASLQSAAFQGKL
ncbi:restriction endonuclease subunit S [Brevundimonas sp.]|uniref:restriction endonuclease subunit S n=1 Tax=Brevundimonas sp. TaxID=1871086 RepID=UPI00289DFB42|nr:restriction endonuclease subunit S [Brevundimonas sp.]